MKKLICIIILLLTCRICNAQNLVPNGDFEQYSNCPLRFGQIDSLLYWFNPCIPPYGGSGTLSGSSDYYNACNDTAGINVPDALYGYQLAHSDSGYAGLISYYSGISNFREYIEVPLTSSLIANNCYYFEMYVSLANISGYTADTIGAYFSDTIVANLHSHLPFYFNPQVKNTTGLIVDTLNWTLINGTFIANGGESYLIIGNFNDDQQTNIFGVSGWTYMAYFYIDDVLLTPCTSIEQQNSNSEIKIYPNPISDKLTVSVKDNNISEIIFYDITSRKLLQQAFTNSFTINTEQLAKGIYLYEVRNKSGLCKKGKVVKD